MTLAALRSEATVGQTLTLAGPKAWTVPEVISLCEKFADERANVTEVHALQAHAAALEAGTPLVPAEACHSALRCAPQVPVWLLKATRGILRSFQWARDAADRLVRSRHWPWHHVACAVLCPPAAFVAMHAHRLQGSGGRCSGHAVRRRLRTSWRPTRPLRRPWTTPTSCWTSTRPTPPPWSSTCRSAQQGGCTGGVSTHMSQASSTGVCRGEVHSLVQAQALTAGWLRVQEYYMSILKKLKQVGASSRQTDFYV